MDPNPEVLQGIYYYLIANQQHIIEKMKPFTERRKNLLSSEEGIFQEEIDKQYEDIVKSTIGDEITAKLGIPIEDVLVILENLNVNEYIK